MKKEYKIDSEIYSDDIMLETISDFKEFADIKYINPILEIEWTTDIEIEEIFGEFMNYVISNINEQ